jgi:hypothetical protein
VLAHRRRLWSQTCSSLDGGPARRDSAVSFIKDIDGASRSQHKAFRHAIAAGAARRRGAVAFASVVVVVVVVSRLVVSFAVIVWAAHDGRAEPEPEEDFEFSGNAAAIFLRGSAASGARL